MNNEKSGCAASPGSFVCPITGFKFCIKPRFLVAALVMIVWTNLFAWFWHGSYLASSYQATASLWRAPADMQQGVLSGGLALMAFFATYIFSKGYEGTGWKEGLRFGILITLFLFGLGLVTYATQPIPFSLIEMWALGDLITYSVGGILLSLLIDKCCSNK